MFALTLMIGNAQAQRFRWPENPENLQVLGDDVKGARLGGIMRGFTTALGVRCEYCHVGEGANLANFDFVSDDKITKRKARVMIQMVEDLNNKYIAELTAIESTPTPRTNVTCITCHRTQNKPVMLENLMKAIIESDGVDAAIEKYHELRDDNYGGFAYNFGSATLTGLGEDLGREDNFSAAISILRLEIEMNGESPSIYYTLGGVQASAQMTVDAIESFEKGLDMAPDDWRPFFQEELDKLRD